jgi:hypothetical protein
MTENNKEYLGDSVYAFQSSDGYGVWLVTDNGYGATNIIYIEDYTYYALKRYWEKVCENIPLDKSKDM